MCSKPVTTSHTTAPGSGTRGCSHIRLRWPFLRDGSRSCSANREPTSSCQHELKSLFWSAMLVAHPYQCWWQLTPPCTAAPWCPHGRSCCPRVSGDHWDQQGGAVPRQNALGASSGDLGITGQCPLRPSCSLFLRSKQLHLLIIGWV